MQKMTDRDWLFPLPAAGPLMPVEENPNMLLWSKLWRSTGWPLDQKGLPEGYVRLPVGPLDQPGSDDIICLSIPSARFIVPTRKVRPEGA